MRGQHLRAFNSFTSPQFNLTQRGGRRFYFRERGSHRRAMSLRTLYTQTWGVAWRHLLPREEGFSSRGTLPTPMAAGLVTIYQRTGPWTRSSEQSHLVTPQNAGSAHAGRLGDALGTRRVLERRVRQRP